MHFSDDYTINIKHLKDQEHLFSYKITKDFFKDFVYDNINNADLDVILILQKVNNIIKLIFNIKGTILTICDRCGDDMIMPISFTHTLYVQLSDIPRDEATDVIFLPLDTQEIDVSPLIFETIVFSIPMRRIHGFDENGNSLCNQETIKILKKYLKEETTEPNLDEKYWGELN